MKWGEVDKNTQHAAVLTVCVSGGFIVTAQRGSWFHDFNAEIRSDYWHTRLRQTNDPTAVTSTFVLSPLTFIILKLGQVSQVRLQLWCKYFKHSQFGRVRRVLCGTQLKPRLAVFVINYISFNYKLLKGSKI